MMSPSPPSLSPLGAATSRWAEAPISGKEEKNQGPMKQELIDWPTRQLIAVLIVMFALVQPIGGPGLPLFKVGDQTDRVVICLVAIFLFARSSQPTWWQRKKG